ncbi:MAG: hypothetical protein EHM61_08800 [Acidobacteria bacterium]|nr:MAG: hypothetical protein EHM61_08800 [Acidobacteriota bacterium]
MPNPSLPGLVIVPSDSGVHRDLAELYEKLGRRAEAARYKQAIMTDAENTDAIQVIVSKMNSLE